MYYYKYYYDYLHEYPLSLTAIRMVTSNFHVKHILQGLVRCFTGRATTATTTEGTTRPAFQLDPRTQSLVASGTPGHLQFYDVYADRQRFNVSTALPLALVLPPAVILPLLLLLLHILFHLILTLLLFK